MRKLSRVLALLLCVAMVVGLLPTIALAAPATKAAEETAIDPTIPIFENPQYSFAERAADLVARMTLKQKAGQMINNTSAISAAQLSGGALDVPATKGISSYTWWSETLHGCRSGVNYPQNTTVASTWNPDLYYQEALNIGQEIRERNNTNLNFYSPTINLHRDPRWGRNEESYSEDVLLTSAFGTQWVLGMEQKDENGVPLDPDGYYNLHTTIKHYVANNNEGKSSGDTTGRLRAGAMSSLRMLREYYALPYGEIIRASDVSSVMTAYSYYNLDPSSYSSYLMDTLLRQVYGLKGHITSDCDSVASMQNLHYTNFHTGKEITMIEALSGALAHGEDLECNGGHSSNGSGTSGFHTDYNAQIDAMIAEGAQTDKGVFTENTVDISVHRLMTARIQTGDLDGNIKIKQDAAARSTSALQSQRRAIVEQINDEGVVMLQNKGVLPLSADTKSVVVVGSWQNDGNTGLYAQASGNQLAIGAGIENAVKEMIPGATVTRITSNSLTDANKTTIQNADAVVVVTGTNSNYSAEDRDRASIILPNSQEELIISVGELNPNTIAVMETCGPMRVNRFENKVNAILWSSFGGQWKNGFGDIISGKVNPSGKVTDTWYSEVNDTGVSDVPAVTDYDLVPMDGKNGRTYMYYNGSTKPSYVFGYGLSYTTFAYSNLTIDKASYDANDTIKVTVDVKNTGSVAGKEIVQIYVAQPDAVHTGKNARPIKRLEGFDKIELQPGETKTVSFEVAVPDLAFFSEELDCFAVDTGKYQLQAGTNSEAAAALTKDFTVSGKLDEYPAVLTIKAAQAGDKENGIEERLIYNKNQVVDPKVTVSMNNEKLYGYIIANQRSNIKEMKSCPLPEGMKLTYSSNRPNVVRVEGDVVKTVGPGVATLTVTAEYNGHTVSGDTVIYVLGNSYLAGITVDGKALEGYAADKHAYELSAANYTKVPEVKAVNEDEDLEVTVVQAEKLPGVAVVTAVNKLTKAKNVYRIGFGKAPVATDFSKGWEAAQAKNWTVTNGDNNAKFGTDGLTITGQAGTVAAGTIKNLYAEPAIGDWVAGTNITLSAAPTTAQSAGMVVYDTADNNVQLTYSGTNVTATAIVDGKSSQIARATVGANTAVSLQIVKQGNSYIFRYSTDGEIWTEMASKATVTMAYPQLGVIAAGSGLTATFDGIDLFKATDLYPRLTGITIDGKALGDFDPEVFSYSYAVDTDAEKAPVVAATADEDLTIEIKQPESIFGAATIVVKSAASSATYTVRFDHGPVSDYFADGDFDAELWEVLRENKETYRVEQGKGIVLPTQRYDIYSTGAAWENCFVTSAMGNWEVVAKVVYPTVPTANYQQAMLLVWQDEDNYIRMNCQTANLNMQPGVETGGSFSGNLGSGSAQAASDGTVTLYYKIRKDGSDYTVGYSQDGVNFTDLGTARGINYATPKIGLFATQNSENTQLDTYFEYVKVVAVGGLQPDYTEMVNWAAQNVADYIAAALPAETSGNIALANAPHGYTVTLNSSDPSVIAADGTVNRPTADKDVKVTVEVADANGSGSAEATIKVKGLDPSHKHNFVAGEKVEATCTTDGYTVYTCSECGNTEKRDVVKALGHDMKETTVAATCTTAGSVTNACSRCDLKEVTEIPALGHDWDNGKVTKQPTETEAGVKTYTCKRCDATRTESIAPLTPGLEGYVLATEIEAGREYVIVSEGRLALTNDVTAKAITVADGKITSEVTDDMLWTFEDVPETVAVASNGNAMYYIYASSKDEGSNMLSRGSGSGGENSAAVVNVGAAPSTNRWSWWSFVEREDGSYTMHANTERDHDSDYAFTINITESDINCTNSYNPWNDLTTSGSAITLYTKAGSDVHTHTWDEGKVTTAATCTTAGVKTYTCAECGKTKTEAIPALGHNMVKGEVTAPTCTAAGYTTYTCSRCDVTEKRDTVAATGHKYGEAVVTKPATCEAAGEKTSTCSVCGDKKTEAIPATGHAYGEAVVTKEATCTEAGEKTSTCANCGDKKTEAIPALGHEWDDGVVTTEPTETEPGVRTYTCARCGETKTEAIDPIGGHDCPSKNFTDVPGVNDWAHAGIDYCVANELMNGTSATLFSPKGTVTRAQLVTILYRVEGQPEVTEPSKFTDVPANQWYTDAIAWAAASGVVKGVSETRFAPMNKITREQIATILYRYTRDAKSEGSLEAFPDAAEVNEWAKEGMIWAVAEGLITGVKNADGTVTLNPGANATRAQIASIIMRYLEAGEAE